jgi:hypothetical protein
MYKTLENCDHDELKINLKKYEKKKKQPLFTNFFVKILFEID